MFAKRFISIIIVFCLLYDHVSLVFASKWDNNITKRRLSNSIVEESKDTLNEIDETLRSIIVVPPGSKCPPGYRPDGKGKCRKPL
ncbi:Protein of unknown function [Cotesia congregata]|uniref:Uncharacterized protein n=1 Tax=Cotesia congregata TaxID=51543 RepID=A0A8J2HDM4_COTCN|nr:Protein of unknown function [Cotesia congregata]